MDPRGHEGSTSLAQPGAYDTTMGSSQERFTRAQFEAARMFVARLRAEASQEVFEFGQIGMRWVPTGDPVVAVTEDEVMLRAGDFVRAALVMLWSLLIEHGEADLVDPAVLVTRLGISLAQYEPEDDDDDDNQVM